MKLQLSVMQIGMHVLLSGSTGYLIKFGESLISWKTRKQIIVWRSSDEAENRSLASTVTELVWLVSRYAERVEGWGTLTSSNISWQQVFYSINLMQCIMSALNTLRWTVISFEKNFKMDRLILSMFQHNISMQIC